MATATYNLYRKRRYKEAGILIEITLDPDTVYYISDAYRTVTNYYEGLLNSISGLDEHLPIDGRFRNRGDARLVLHNKKLQSQAAATNKFSDLLADEYLIGATVEILQYFEGIARTDCETIYKGVIEPGIRYNENYVYLTVSAAKRYPKLPTDYIVTDAANTEGFSNTEDTSVGAIMPVVWGKVDNSTTTVSGIDITSYGGALKLRHEIDTVNHYWLVAGHRCDDIIDVYDNNTKGQVVTEYTGSGNRGGGPSWRDICYLEPNAWTVTIDEDTVDVHGMESYGDLSDDPGIGTLLENPLSCLEQTLRIFLPVTDADFGTSFDDTSDCDDLKCWGPLESQYEVDNLFTLFMTNFPIWLYYNRSGQLEYIRQTFNPATNYTERELSYDDDIKLLSVSLRQDCYNGITVRYWKNFGRDIEAAKGNISDYKDSTGWHFRTQTVAAGGGDYLANAFIKVRVQYSGKLMAQALNTTDISFLVDTGSVEPRTTIPKELILVDHELMEVTGYNAGTGQITVYARGACGTTVTTHADNTPIYYMHIHSSNGTYSRDQQMEYTGNAIDDDKLYIDEGGGAAATIGALGYASRYIRNPERLASYVQTELNGAGALNGAYTVTWNPEDGTFTISSDTSFFLDYSNCDYLADIMGFTEDSDNGTSCTSDSRAFTREAQAAYAYARYGINRTREINGDLIRGETLETQYAAGSRQCDTAVEIRNHWFDMLFRPKKQVNFEASLVLADLELGDIVEFNSDIDNHLKCHGATWADLKWRVIDIYRPAMDRIKFTVEEV